MNFTFFVVSHIYFGIFFALCHVTKDRSNCAIYCGDVDSYVWVDVNLDPFLSFLPLQIEAESKFETFID